MPLREETELARTLARILDPRTRFADLRLRLRVWGRDDSATPPGRPTDEVSEVLGGWWDAFSLDWVPEDIARAVTVGAGHPWPDRPPLEIPVHRRQYDALLGPRRAGLARRLIIAGPGTGKTRYLALAVIITAIRRPHLTSGVVGATTARVDTVWQEILKLLPEYWINDRRVARGDRSLTIATGHRIDFVGGRAPAHSVGTAIQGRTWCAAFVDETQNVEEDAQRDVDERGRQAGTSYCVDEVATNHGGGDWEIRKEWYAAHPATHEILRWHPHDNVFVALAYWDRLMERSSDYTFRRRIFAEDLPPERLVYGAFSFAGNLRPRPSRFTDVTRKLTAERWGQLRPSRDGRGWDWIAGTDWGRLTTVTIWLKAFRDEHTGDTSWWACHETTSREVTAEEHSKTLISEPWATPDGIIVVADPGINTRDADKSDYELARRTGLLVRPAHHEPVRVAHRVNMLSSLFCDARGVRRLFVDVDEVGAPACKRLVGALLSMVYAPNGDPEGAYRKDARDPTHWPAALAYGLFPWEQIRGMMSLDHVEAPTPVTGGSRWV